MAHTSDMSWFDGASLERKPLRRIPNSARREFMRYVWTGALTGFTGITGFAAMVLLLTSSGGTSGWELGAGTVETVFLDLDKLFNF